jgi:hypothetical protein
LFMQVMPVFFLVGGYVNARSWAAHHDRGEGWADWVRERAVRLLWPTTVYVAVAILAVAGARVAGASAAELARAGWLVAFQLWFLPVYLLLIAAVPLPALAAYGLGVIGTLLSGRPPSRGAPQASVPRPRPSLEMPAGEHRAAKNAG